MTTPRTGQDWASHQEAESFRRDMEQSALRHRSTPGFRPGVDYDEEEEPEDNEEL
jgi:hypothetical protein